MIGQESDTFCRLGSKFLHFHGGETTVYELDDQNPDLSVS